MGALDGRVVIVTGAGGGIGRAHALACARSGARVVVNDLGGARDGTGAGSTMAETVRDEILALGGEAIASAASVTDFEACETMVAEALATWGRVDGVVNNAGILRDRTFAKMSAEDWDLVLDVHLTGTRNVTRAALNALCASGGAIVNTTSYSGMIGNFGQANYAAAKAGIYGFTRVLALELKKKGVTANCVAPVAKTRMTDDLVRIPDDWRPEQISPIVVYLLSEGASHITGQVFGVQGQRIHVYEVKTNEGVEKAGDELWTVEELTERIDDICRFDAEAPALEEPVSEDLVTQVFSMFPVGYRPGGAPGWEAVMHWVVRGGTDQTVEVLDGACTARAGLHGKPTCTVKIDKDTLIAMFKGELDPTRAFMTGKASADDMGTLMKMGQAFDFARVAAVFADEETTAGMSHGDDTEAAPVGSRAWPIGKRYDGGFWLVDGAELTAYADAIDDDNPAYRGPDAVAPPMYHVRPFIDLMMKLASDPELDLDLLRLVHGEHAMRFRRPLRHGDVLQLRGSLESVQQKASGRVVTYGLYGMVEGEIALEGITTYFIRGERKEGGGSARKPDPAVPPPPTWAAAQTTTDDQAIRYAAASGDENPIHVDEETARAAGLPRTILHGLCTMAFAQRDIVAKACGGDPGRLAFLSVRFAKPVFPGEELTLKVWKQGDTLDFITENAAGKAVIVNGRAEIVERA